MIKHLIIYLWQLFKRPYYLFKHNRIPLSTRVDNNCTLTFCKVGNYCYIRSGAQFNHTVIGNYSSFAADVQIGGMEHPLNKYSTSAKLFNEDCVQDKITRIGNDVWIAAGSIIRQGITIGDGAVVGANSFVNKDVPPYAIVAGSPAIILRYRFNDETIKRIIDTKYWDYPPVKAKVILKSLDKENESC